MAKNFAAKARDQAQKDLDTTSSHEEWILSKLVKGE